ncbi:deoxynucleotide monophosphate kinase family protein [Psychrobacter sp. AOP7-B1-24]|uniref:deoxynucleotide monophosphate kinase family protein n=1 Tax=Psychrobacter sp. AOP7-B1-24 TaxID=3457645 RepID=UPI00402B786D
MKNKSKTLARHGSLDEYVDSLPAHESYPVVDDTFNDDTVAQTFGESNAGKYVIVPDVRFENEADLVREHGVLIHLVGRGGIEGNHVSENAIEFKPGDIVIDNSRDLAWLYSQVDGNAALGEFISEVSE